MALTEDDIRRIVRDELEKVEQEREAKQVEIEESMANECWPAGMDNYGSLDND